MAKLQTSDFPLPPGSNQNPIRANYPRQLIVFDGSWEPCTDQNVLAGKDYLAVSYRQSDFPDKKALEKIVRNICFKKGIEAYWIDFACTGETPEEKNEDLYRIADVFRNAKTTLILIKGDDDRPLSDGWVSWGMRIWTFPEALLSTAFLIQAGLSKIAVKELSLNQVANHAYGSGNGNERLLIDLYSHTGKDFSQIPERFEMLCKAIWSRRSGPDFLVAQPSSSPTAYPAENVYAVMGFLLHRVMPVSTESEDEAFKRLLDENGLTFDTYPRIAYSSDGAGVLGVKDKKETSARESYVLPQHIPEARFDYNRSGRRKCEEGTRMETLATIYRWLKLKGYWDSNDSSHHAEPEKDVLWLRGLAGSGKSTISQTAAEKCDVERILGASYFCSRYTAALSNYLNIFPTISCQLCRLSVEFKRRLSKIFEEDKDLQYAEADRQLEKLILEPLKAAHQFPSVVIIIDALDECMDNDTKSIILTALGKCVTKLKPLKFLITSRPDHNINVVFKTLSLANDTEKFNLDKVDPSLTDRDLRIVLTKGLADVRQEYDLPDSWPTEEDISNLVDHAQHLFVFISTAIKFIGDSSVSNPKKQLDRLLHYQSTDPSRESYPYAYLDNLYRQVFQTAFPKIDEELRAELQTVLVILVLGRELFSISKLEGLMVVPLGTVRRTLLKLHALLVVPENDQEDIRLIHSSMHDFLTNQKRCIDSRFYLNTAAGHSVIVRCSLKTITKFADNEEMQLFLKTPTERRLISARDALDKYEYSAVKYSFTHWHKHALESNLNEEIMKYIKEFISNRCRCLLIYDPTSTAIALLHLIRKLTTPCSLVHFPLLMYQSALLLFRNEWLTHARKMFVIIYGSELWMLLETLRADFQITNGLFGLNEETAALEVVIVYLRDFIPRNALETDDPELNLSLYHLRKAADDLHNVCIRQNIPKNDRARSDVSLIADLCYRDLDTKMEKINILESETEDFAAQLKIYLSALLDSIKQVKGLFEIINENSDFSQLYIKSPFTATDTGDFDRTTFLNAVRAIFAVIFLSPNELSVAELKGLMSLLCLPQGSIHTIIHQYPLFVTVPDNDSHEIHVNNFNIAQASLSSRDYYIEHYVIVNRSLEHNNIAGYCIERLLRFASSSEMQLYSMYPSISKKYNLRFNLRNNEDLALRYAFGYWIFHIDKSGELLDDSALQLLSEFVSNYRVLDLLVTSGDDAVSMLLTLCKKLLNLPSPPLDIIKVIYVAVIYLQKDAWPGQFIHIQKHSQMILEVRRTLCTRLSCNDGLYDLDSNLRLIQVTLLHFADFLPYDSVPLLENSIRELRNCANEVHEILLQQTVPGDESILSMLKECMWILHEELESAHYTHLRKYWPYKTDNTYTQALHSALVAWCKSLDEFKAKVIKMLGVTYNITLSESKSVNAVRTPATISELSDTVYQATSLSSSFSFRLFVPTPRIQQSSSGTSIRTGAETEAELQESTIAHTTSIELPSWSQEDSPANEPNDEAVECTGQPSVAVERPTPSPASLAQNAKRRHIMLLEAMIGVILGIVFWYFYISNRN